MLRILVSTLILAVLATITWSYVGEKDFETAATRTALTYEMREKCPLSYAALKTENVGLVSICSTFGLKSYIAAQGNRDIAGELFGIYGELEDFRLVVERYGPEALAVIQYFRERDSKEFRFKARVRQIWEQLKSGESFDTPAVKLSPDEHGFLAIQELKRRGHELLAQFEFVDGTKRKQVKRLISTATDLFTGGITDLEARIIRGEKVTWRHVAHAALDAAVIVGGTAAVVKVLRAGKTVHGTTMLAKAGGAFSTARTVVKTVAVVGAVSVAAVVAYNPSLLISGAGWIAEQLGLPAWFGVLVLAGIVALPLMMLVEFVYRLLRHISWPARKIYRVGKWMHNRYQMRRTARALRIQKK